MQAERIKKLKYQIEDFKSPDKGTSIIINFNKDTQKKYCICSNVSK